MRISRTILFVISTAVLSISCATYSANEQDVLSEVDAMVAERKFVQALTIIETLQPQHPQHGMLLQKVPQIRTQATAYGKNIGKQARLLAEKKEWYTALLVLDDAIFKIPESQALSNLRASIALERDAHVEKLRMDVMLSRGQRLPKEIPMLREIARLTPDDASAQADLKRSLNEQKEAIKSLYNCGHSALLKEKYRTAKTCLELAQGLGSNKQIEEALAVANLHLKKHSQSQLANARSRYETALEKGDLVSARKQLDALINLWPNNTEFKELRSQLETRINTKIRKDLEAGRLLYSRGEIEPALKVWQAALPLEPENLELQADIARAQRVLEKIKELSEKQGFSG